MEFIKKRAADFSPDQEKFSTQRAVTYLIILIFAATTAFVFYNNDQSERSMVLQTIINLTLLAVGYWLGASKQAQDQAHGPAANPAVAMDVKADNLTVNEQPTQEVKP